MENRLTSANGEQYVYNPSGERICKLAGTLRCQEIRFYGAFGELLGTYQVTTSYPYLTFSTQTTNLYFAAKLVQAQGKWVVLDRLGSVRANSAGEVFQYYPYGEERPQATAQNREKFATYYRDGTGLDYAYQRYYQNTTARFLTPDPKSGGDIADPGSFNAYAYVRGDPVNGNDPTGLDAIFGWNFFGAGSLPKLGTWSFSFNMDVSDEILPWYGINLMLFSRPVPRSPLWSGDRTTDANRRIIYQVDNDPVFRAEILDCMAGIESQWRADRVATDAQGMKHRGLYQFAPKTWQDSNTNLSYDDYVKNPAVSTLISVRELYQKLTYAYGNAYIRSAGAGVDRTHMRAAIAAWRGGPYRWVYADSVLNCADNMTIGNVKRARD